jgi:hypothetical protein
MMNSNIKILGILHVILGGGGMLACMGVYACWINIASDAHSLRTAHTLGQMMFMLSMFILLPSLICGIGLLRTTSWGRVVAIGWSMLLLLVIPIGTLLGAYGLWVSLKQSPPPARPARAERRATASLLEQQRAFRGRNRLLLVMVIVGSSMIVLLRMGFWMAGEQPPAVIVGPFYIATVLLIAIVVPLIVVAVGNGLMRPGLSRNNRSQFVQPTQRLDRDVLCVHLQPIESAMRAFGINTSQSRGYGPQANCQIDRAALQREFGPTVAALYVERHDIDRSYLDPKTALLYCATCNSQLWVAHADAAIETTPWFPNTSLHSSANADLAAS